MTTLGHIGDPADDEDRAARAVVTALKDALPPGGYLAICDLTSTDPAQNAALRTYNHRRSSLPGTQPGTAHPLVRRPGTHQSRHGSGPPVAA